MTLLELIDFALTNPPAADLYEAYDRTRQAAQNDRGQVLDVHTNTALDVLKPVLMLRRHLTADERRILEGLRPTQA